jgi:hypothetical protein
MPTLEEFTNIVKLYFRDGWKNLTSEQVDEYIYGEEAQRVIINRYNEEVKAYKNGDITEQQFWVGATSSVANCLIYMY